MSWCGSLRSPAPYVFCSVASPITPLAHRPVTRQSFQIPQGRTCVGLSPFSGKATLAVRNKRKSSAFNDPNQKAGNPGEGPVCSPLHGVSRKPAQQYQQPIPPDRPHFLEKTPNNGEDGLADRQTGDLADGRTDRPANWRPCRRADWPTGGLADWPTGGLADWPTGRPANWRTCRRAD